MKKTMLALFIASGFFYSNAHAKPDEVIKNISGVQVHGCELIIDNEETYFGINVNNIRYYKYDKKKEMLIMTYNNLYHGAEMKAKIHKENYKEEMDKFVKLRNHCAFIEKMN